MSELKRTPIFPAYEKVAKTIDFGGWDLPVQFSGIKEEHETVRTKAGLFDVSHMGEILVSGPESAHFLQTALSNDITKLVPNKAQYTMMCYEDGGTVDDLIVYMLAENEYLLVVNAANTEKDFEWLLKQNNSTPGVTLDNISENYAQLALQGPKAEQILQKVVKESLSDISFFRFKKGVAIEGIAGEALISRTGYTGEDGFEIYLDSRNGKDLWNLLLEKGKEEGIEPIGLGARDTLRFEAGLALYGQELAADISPLEAGLGFAVKLNKEAEFTGKEALKKQAETGLERKLAGIEMIDKGIPRHGYSVYQDDTEIGFITSGTQSPTLNKNLGLALIHSEFAEIGTELEVQVRKRRLKAKVVKTPFYRR
ncbi:glycine cleavage system aminomethyltransferase GcvT [Oceanobacillus sojae]|uniref:glycine cleavage system aminomethyltransferase GcvT n=1 Tax=Oceanobacillus sojae TaxID=582851 RepID=UPI00098875FA|nr:glycine cleavage system aminomethyltransferase GcvT [Oceanobacillus sojae]MCT1903929.1 glycine cleavage system aminomethyltransferase GcvT [Oceanobacillus sojae]